MKKQSMLFVLTNLITHSLTYSQEMVTDYFITPLFVGGKLSEYSTVKTGIKVTKELDKFSSLSKITKAYAQGASFTDSTGVTLTRRTITVAGMKAEAVQNGHAFENSVMELATKSGVNEGDIGGTILEQIVLEIFTPALEADLLRQAWFGATNKTTLSSGIPTATADADYNQYTGWWTRIIADFASSTIASAQRVNINSSTYQTTVAVAQVTTSTITGTSGTANITFNGTAYLATFDTSLTVTAANFVTTHAATIAARYGGVVVTSSAGDVIFTASQPGVAFSASAPVNASGNLTGSVAATTANVKNTTLKTDAASTAMGNILANAANELVSLDYSTLEFHVTRSFRDNYLATLRAQSGSEASFYVLINGIPTLTYAGIPVRTHYDWDGIISADFTGQYPHRCLLTTKQNLVFGTDGTDDSTTIESFYDQTLQLRYFRAEYKAGTQYVDGLYIAAAY